MSGLIDSQFQLQITGTITANAQTRDVSSPNTGNTLVQLTGTWSGTIVIEGSNDGTNFVALQVMNISTFVFGASMTANGVFACNTNGFQYYRLRSTAWTSGTAVFTVYGADATSIVHVPGVASSANQDTQITQLGGLTETAPASDTASSGLNGRLQRIAQRLTSLIALIPNVNTIAFFTRLSDGTTNVAVSTNGDLAVQDGLSGGGLFAALSVPTANTPVEVKVGGSRLANRKLVTFQAIDSDFYWGYANTVAIGTGTLIKKGATVRWSVDPTAVTPAQFWVVASTNTKTGRVTESP